MQLTPLDGTLIFSDFWKLSELEETNLFKKRQFFPNQIVELWVAVLSRMKNNSNLQAGNLGNAFDLKNAKSLIT